MPDQDPETLKAHSEVAIGSLARDMEVYRERGGSPPESALHEAGVLHDRAKEAGLNETAERLMSAIQTAMREIRKLGGDWRER